MFMSNPAQEMAERQGRMLAELAELTLGAARELQGRLVAAETPSEAAELGLAFQRVSRSLRQTLLLEAKLAKEARAAEREQAAEAERAREEGFRERKSRLREAVTREIAETCESLEEAEELATAAEAMLDGYVRDPELAGASLEALNEALCHDLGLDEPAHDEADDGDDDADDRGDLDETESAGDEAPKDGPPDPDPAPAAPPEPAPPPEPTWHPATGQRVIRDPDHGGWRVVGDST